MADIKFSEFPKATISKDSDEIAILQDGVNKMIPSPVLESKIINKTVTRVIDQGGASLNVINLKGVVPTYADLATITPTPELNDAYQVEADGLVYVYTDTGFQADGEGFVVQPEPNGVVEEGNTQAVSGGEVYKNIVGYSSAFDYNKISDNNILKLINSLEFTQKIDSNIDLYLIRLFYNSDTKVFQVIFNANKNISGGLPIQTYVFNGNLNDNLEYTGVNILGDLRIVLNNSITESINFNVQTLPSENWVKANLKLKITDKTYNTFKPFNEYVSNTPSPLRNSNLQAFRNIEINYQKNDTDNYIISLLRKGYTGDGVGKENQIWISRQPKVDFGTNNNLTIIADYAGPLNNSIQEITLYNYSPNVVGNFKIIIDWSLIPDNFNANWQGSGMLLTKKAFIGFDKFYSISELIERKPDRAIVGGSVFQRKKNSVKSINDYSISSENKNINTILNNVHSLNLGETLKFRCAGNDGKFYFTDGNVIKYCNSIEDLKTLNLTTLHAFTKPLATVKTLNNGELLVVTRGNWSESLLAEIWTSSQNRTIWDKKSEFNNFNNETHFINQWGFSQFGDVVVISSYGKRYTSNEPGSDAPKYTNITEKANYSIWVSYNNGNTWNKDLFNLGSYFADNLKPYAHIHASYIDPYWNEIIVSMGDVSVSPQANRIFRTTNFAEYVENHKKGIIIPLTWTSDITYKIGGLGSVQENLLFGSDDTPNGIYRAVRTDYAKIKSELAFTEQQWSYQRVARNPDGTPNTGSEYGMWGGYQFERSKGSIPTLATNLYMGGSHIDDYKRNQIIATIDGFNFYKIWESKYDLINKNGTALSNNDLFIQSTNDGYILLQENNGEFTDFDGGKPVNTLNRTLHIFKY